MKKYKENVDFFKIIDTQEKAYFLGLLYADGYMTKVNTQKVVSLSSIDKEIIDSFQKAITTNRPVRFIDAFSRGKYNFKTIYNITISDKNFYENLYDKGLFNNKSLTLCFPSIDIVPYELTPHFIRGYFDGDGCVWEGKRYKSLIKDSTQKSGTRIRVIHNVKFTVVGSIYFIDTLQNIIVKQLGFRKTKLIGKKGVSPLYCQMEYSGRLQMKKFYDYIYKDSTVFLERKKDKFLSILDRANI